MPDTNLGSEVMKKIVKKVSAVVLMALLCIVYGCGDDDSAPVLIENKDLSFSAINLSDLGHITVRSTDEVYTSNWELNLDINGNKSSYSGTSKKNVLPVLVGNEIEVTFDPSVDENDATFTLPDGTTRKVTRAEPSFKWTVPQTIKNGDQITGVSSYRKDNTEYKNRGRILFEVVDLHE